MKPIKSIFGITVSLFIILYFSSCGTVFRGYTDEVVIYSKLPIQSIRTIDGINLGIDTLKHRIESNNSNRIFSYYQSSIQLPRSKNYVIVVKDSLGESTHELIRTIDTGIFLLDLLNPIAFFIDFVTNNMYGFPSLTLKPIPFLNNKQTIHYEVKRPSSPY